MYTIRSEGAPKPTGSYSQGTSAARYVFVSSQLPIDPATGALIEASLGAQVARCVENVEAVLKDVDLSLEDVCLLHVWLTDLRDLEIVDEVLAERIARPYPARSVIGVSELPLGAPVQIEAIACR